MDHNVFIEQLIQCWHLGHLYKRSVLGAFYSPYGDVIPELIVQSF